MYYILIICPVWYEIICSHMWYVSRVYNEHAEGGKWMAWPEL